MKIPIHFKTPDVIKYALDYSLPVYEEWEEEQRQQRMDMREQFKEDLKKWVMYGECVELEFDTELKTLIVKEV